MKKVLFVDTTGEKILGFREMCAGLDIEVTEVENVIDAIGALDNQEFEALVTESNKDLFQFMIDQKKFPLETVVIFSHNDALNEEVKELFFFQNQHHIRFIEHDFEFGQKSDFANIIRTLV